MSSLATTDTIAYYNKNAERFVSDTADAPMGPILSRFLAHIPANGSILDWGCGSGRDSLTMLQTGYCVDATDASKAMCETASKLTGLSVCHETFDQLEVEAFYDGIWANASLLHARSSNLPSVLQAAATALKPYGVLYTSFKLGNFEGMRNGRWFTDMTEPTLREIFSMVPEFGEQKFWATHDVRPERNSEQWLNCLAFRR